jgi:Acetyltransferase (GNAT) domain
MEPFNVRSYQSGDEKTVAALFKEVFGKGITVAQWTWKYALPGKGKIYSKIAEDASHNVIGHAGAIPLRGVYQKRPLQFFQIADVMVHPGARGFLGKRSVFDPLMKGLFEGIREEFPDVFCYGFPGQRPFILGKRIRVYDEIETAADCVIHPKFSFFNPCRIEALPWGDSRLDTLWSSLSDSMLLSLIRDKEYLNWRYASNPFYSYQLLGIFCSGQLRGWFVLRGKGEEILIIDFLTEEILYKRALKALRKHLSAQKGKVIRLWLPEKLRKKLTVCRTEKTEVVVTNMIWKLPLPTESIREDLYYTMGDADIF